MIKKAAQRITEANIVHEVGSFWVLSAGPTLFRVLETSLTHSTVVGTFHYSNDPERARARAIADANRRAAG